MLRAISEVAVATTVASVGPNPASRPIPGPLPGGHDVCIDTDRDPYLVGRHPGAAVEQRLTHSGTELTFEQVVADIQLRLPASIADRQREEDRATA